MVLMEAVEALLPSELNTFQIIPDPLRPTNVSETHMTRRTMLNHQHPAQTHEQVPAKLSESRQQQAG